MSSSWLVQVGCFGHVGRFTARDALPFSRGQQVICRTNRGLEVGRILNQVSDAREDDPEAWQTDGDLLRPMSEQDHLLWERIGRHQRRACLACEQLLQERGLNAVLMDVESLFDGSTLYFYFLGKVDSRVEALTGELADAYEAKVRFKPFAQRLAEGCGPGCGTSEASGGCGSGGCGSCGLQGACQTGKVRG